MAAALGHFVARRKQAETDLRAAMPYGLLAVPRSQVVRMHYSSGTTGIATAVYHTADDLRYWAECVARGAAR